MTEAAAMAVPQVARPRRRWLWRAGWATLCLVGAVVGFWTWSYYSALSERDALIAEIQTKGQPVWWWDVADRRLEKSNDGTGAPLYLEGIDELGGETNPRKLRRPTQQWTDEVEPNKFLPRVDPRVENEVQLSAPALAILERSAALPPGRIIQALRNGEPVSIILSQVQDMRRVQRACHWTSFDALVKGDAKRAYHATWLAMAVSEQLANEPFVVAQLVRIVVLSEAVDQLAMCLSWAPVPEADFTALDAVLSKWDDGFSLKETLVCERAMWLTTVGQPNVGWILTMGSRRAATLNGFNRALEGALLDLIGSKAGRPITLRAQAQFIEAFNQLASRVDDPAADLSGIEKEAEELDRKNVLGRVTGEPKSSGIGWLAKLSVNCAKVHRKLVLARLALRLRRYYNQHGRLPKELEEICDKQMPRIRNEWFKGRPIEYAASATGFRLETMEPIWITSGSESKEGRATDEHGMRIEFKGAGGPKREAR